MILASPVQAFSLAEGMKAYLGSLEGKKTACFVTKQLKGAWTGATKALRTMRAAVEKRRGGTVAGSAFVVWSSKEREQQISNIVEKLAGLF